MRALLLLVLLLSGCRKNHDELRTRLAALDVQLASQQAIAQKLNDDRRALDAAEQELADALAQFPEEKAAADALEEAPLPPAVTPTFPPLPPESSFEGVEGARLRLQIAATEARIVALSKVLDEVEKLNARRRHVQRKLELVRSHRKP